MQEITQEKPFELEGYQEQELSKCLIGSTLLDNGILDLTTESFYSVDMVRFNLKINPTQVSEFHTLIDTWIPPKRTIYYSSNSIGGYRNLWKLEFEESSISVGLCHVTGSGKTEASKGFIEANPNKVGSELVALIKRFLGNGARIEPVRFDLAIDYPIERNTVRLLKDGRKYGCVMSDSFTEYLGQRNKAGFAKVYDKQAESNLETVCTRVELTCSAEWTPEQILEKLPKVFTYSGNEFKNLKRSTKAFAIAVQAHLANGDTLEPWLTLCNSDTKTKLRKAFGEQQALAYSLNCITEAMKNVPKIANGTWVSNKEATVIRD